MTVAKNITASGGVLVAHDGSAHADSALRSAVHWASITNSHVTVVRAWSLSTAPRPSTWTAGYVPPLEDFEAATLAALEKDVAAVRAEHPEVPITTTVVHGSPASALIEASANVDLLVVGSRGHGGFKGLLLGSVSEQVVRHARCTVVVERDSNSADSAGPAEPAADDMENALLSELKLDD